jgi:peptidoglycan/LPS O-acetylase OafA/YrhL
MLDYKRQNNFDAVRLFLAMTVVLGHLMWLLPGNYGPLQSALDHFDGPRAVDCFFVISGFLIFRSFRRSKSHLDYWGNRARRIYPALAAVIVATIIWGAFVTTASPTEYFSSPTLGYLIYNLLFMSFKQSSLPGVFENNQIHYLNGALWTLKIEAMFYISVPFIVLFSRKFLRFEILAVVLYLLSIIFKITLHHIAVTRQLPAYDNWGSQLPGQLSFFMAGGLLEYCSEAFRRHASIYLGLAVVGLIISAELGVYALYPVSLAIVVIYACDVLPYLGNISKYGDFSYGLYVSHFPILVSFAALSVLPGNPLLRAAMALLVCLLYAILSWHLIEKRWLRPKSRVSPVPVRRTLVANEPQPSCE